MSEENILDGYNVRTYRCPNAKGTSLQTKFIITCHKIFFNLACRPDGTVNRRLLNVLDVHKPPSHQPINGVITSDHTINSSHNLWFRLFVPVVDTPSDASLPVIIYFHGGGFILLSAATVAFDTFCRRIAGELSAIVVSVNYRLSPEHRWPTQYDDGINALRFLDNGGLPENADLCRCFISGDSAGANLAHHVMVRVCETHFKNVKICGMILIQPFFGGEERTESELQFMNEAGLTLNQSDFLWKAFLPEGSDRDHPGANVLKSKDVSGLDLFPPTLVIIGGSDLLQDRERMYCNWLRESGKVVESIEYSEVKHGLACAPELPQHDMLVGHVKEFVQKQLQL